ncbi:MAG: hypothetical protein RL406_462 [Pseudomonadota bacterium]|jgi:hypothetical protein
MSGLSRTPGKRVWVNSPPRVRIPLAPPKQKAPAESAGAFFLTKKALAAAFLRLFNDALGIRIAVCGG